MLEPHYKILWNDLIPIYTHKDENNRTTLIEIIAGKIDNLKVATPPTDSWAANSANEVAVWNIKKEAGAKWILPKASEGIN